VTRCQLALDKMTPFSAALLQRRLVDSKQLHSQSFIHSFILCHCLLVASRLRPFVTLFLMQHRPHFKSPFLSVCFRLGATLSRRTPQHSPNVLIAARRSAFPPLSNVAQVLNVALHNISACMQRRFAPTPTPVPRHCMLPAARHFHFTAPTAHPLPTFITLFQADCLPTLAA
jgi:hypothetical protein